jgi:glutamate-1-semialdehyde 2,1-aminomutase
MRTDRSRELLAQAEAILPGGVNSPVRAFRAVGGTPRFIRAGRGCRVTDVDGNTYVDYVGSWGPLLLGHSFAPVVDAVRDALTRGTSFGAPTEGEIELATEIRSAVPSMEMLRLVNSGTEATLSALRLARGFTGRELVVKFEGGYHGHVDALLVKAGSGLATLGIADSAGVPASIARDTLVLPYNDISAVEQAFREHGARIAAIIVEPVAGNMGCVPPAPGFLECLRDVCTRSGALLIFDEVMTGFRVHFGGAQQLYGIRPDLSTFGKVIGGGLPLAAYGGRADIMRRVAPLGDVYQAGTLSGNPLAVAAGLAMVRHLKNNLGIYQQLEENAARLCAAAPAGTVVNRVGSMFTFFFTDAPVTDWPSAKRCDTTRFRAFFAHLIANNVYFPPSQFEAAFLGAAHDQAAIDATIRVLRDWRP